MVVGRVGKEMVEGIRDYYGSWWSKEGNVERSSRQLYGGNTRLSWRGSHALIQPDSFSVGSPGFEIRIARVTSEKIRIRVDEGTVDSVPGSL